VDDDEDLLEAPAFGLPALQPVNDSATAFSDTTRPWSSVAMTPSPMLASVTLSRSAISALRSRSTPERRATKNSAATASNARLVVANPVTRPDR
jgi:hypothetical protein